MLDHGLYEYMKPKDRVALCKLYSSIIMKDEEGMKKHALEMGVQGVYTILWGQLLIPY